MREGRDHHVGSEVRRLLGGLDRRGDLGRARAVSAWQEIAGPEVAAHAAGYAMRGPELVVFTDNPVWASELSALSEQYRVAVNEHLGQEMVGSIRFTVSKHARRRDGRADDEEAASDRAGSPRTVDPVPLSEAETAALSRMAEGIHDERLREAALAAARRHLEWRRGLTKADGE